MSKQKNPAGTSPLIVDLQRLDETYDKVISDEKSNDGMVDSVTRLSVLDMRLKTLACAKETMPQTDLDEELRKDLQRVDDTYDKVVAGEKSKGDKADSVARLAVLDLRQKMLAFAKHAMPQDSLVCPQANLDENEESLKEFDRRVEAAAKAMRLTVEAVVANLKALGIERDEDAISILDSDEVTAGDMLPQFVHGSEKGVEGKTKPILFKLGFACLKPKKAKDSERKVDHVSQLVEQMRPVEQWGDRELVEKYGSECDSRVSEELQRRCKGRRFVIFNEDGAVDIDNTVELLRLARRQDTPTTYSVNGNIVRVSNVGEFPNLWFEECPLHPDLILANGYCDRDKVSWANITLKDRVIVRVASMVDPDLFKGAVKVAEVIDRIERQGADWLLQIGPIGLKYRELEEEDRLPKLRKKTSRTQRNGDPFFVARGV